MCCQDQVDAFINRVLTNIIVFVINGVLNTFYNIFKFSVVLFLVFCIGIWIFEFWDAVIDHTIPATYNNRYLREQQELQEDAREIQAEFESLIKAELRGTTRSRSSQFEATAAISIVESAKWGESINRNVTRRDPNV